jgi:D-alanyl-D-alanine carboxypeptidase
MRPLLLSTLLALATLGGCQGPSKGRADSLQARVDQAVDGRRIHGVVVRIESPSLAWTGSAGDLGTDSAYFQASITKMYVTAAFLRLKDAGRLSLDDPISKHLPRELWRGIHVLDGVDHSGSITLRQLLSNTSGLPDYFAGPRPGGPSLEAQLAAGIDQAWSLEDVAAYCRSTPPPFRPGAPGKALYSDSNFQLAGRVLEAATGQPLGETLADLVIRPLGLRRTWLYPQGPEPSGLHAGDRPLELPRAMACMGADGGMVSTAEDSMIFLRAFFEGRLFAPSDLQEIQDWNGIFFPFAYGMGIARFSLPRLLTLGGRTPVLLGHPASTGAFAFWWPEKRTFITGTLNQVEDPSRAYRLVLRLLGEL